MTLGNEHDVFFNCSIDLLAVVGADGYFKRVNPAFERALGYSKSELLAKPVVDFLHPEDVSNTKKRLATLAGGTPTITSQNRYLCKDGTYKWFSWNTTPIESLFYSVGRDITEQRKIEEQIRELNSELGKQNELLEKKVQERMAELQASEAQVRQLQKMDAIGRLAGGIAHDFNNILSVITLYCDLLDEEAEKPQSIREYLQDVRQATTRGANLTQQLLVFSRKQIFQRKTIHLNQITKDLKKMLTRLIGDHEIVTDLADDLKPTRGDPGQMEQILMNLVVNARDAMPNGGRITIETKNVYLDETFSNTHLSATPGEYVLLSVTDTGCGMDAATLSKIFDPFFTTKEVGKGTGLGLTTVYGIVKQSKGSIWAYSEPNKGTIFKIYLPIAKEATGEIFATPATKIKRPVGNQTVLLVEDDNKLRDGFSKMLQRTGYEVMVAQNGKDALKIFQSSTKPIHLLITDVVMPGLNGFELAKKAAEIREDLRVLFMSGYTSDALENNVKDFPKEMEYIQKPFNTSALVGKVQEIFA